jgi:hypothetical protein
VHTAPEYFRSDVPAGFSGAWVIEKVTIPDRDYDPGTDSRPDCFKFRPGIYTSLRRGSTQFMTDLYDEWWTQRTGIAEAQARGGEVLITGLGLGLVAEAMLRPVQSRVQRITIVEYSSDVIQLVAPHLDLLYPGKIEIIEADAFTWEPPRERRFTVGWHDIWPDPYAPENAEEMKLLEEHYRPWCTWQGFWPKTYLDAAANQSQEQ